MFRRRILAVVVVGLAVRSADAASGKVNGGDPRFATAIASRIGDKPVRLVLTGTAMRTRYGFSVYAIGSYVQEGVTVHDGDELARVAAPKQLHLIFEREVDGATIAQSFRESIGMGHPAPAFAPELAKLEQYFRAGSARRGDHIWMTYVPGAGLACQLAGRPGILIENVEFARAAWEVYLGRQNLGMAIKSGLTSRL